MLGFTIRLAKYAVAGAIMLLLGSQILISVSGVVWSLRFGNPLPLLIAIGLTIIMLRLTQRQQEDSLSERVLNVLSLVCVGYLVVFALVMTLATTGNIIVSIAAGAVTVLSCKKVYDTPSLSGYLSNIANGRISLRGSDGFNLSPKASEEMLMDRLDRIQPEVIMINKKDRESILALMRERPTLPWSLTVLEHSDALLVITRGNRLLLQTVISLLRRANVKLRRASPALRRLVLAIPIIDRNHGLPMTEYHLVFDEATVERLLELAPVRMTLFPRLQHRVGILLPESAAPGMYMEEIPFQSLVRTILGRDFSPYTHQESTTSQREEENGNTT